MTTNKTQILNNFVQFRTDTDNRDGFWIAYSQNIVLDRMDLAAALHGNHVANGGPGVTGDDDASAIDEAHDGGASVADVGSFNALLDQVSIAVRDAVLDGGELFMN